MGVLESVYDFIYKYFVHPIESGEGYNPVNTPVLAVLFIFLVVSCQKMIKSLKIPMNQFLRHFIPYVFLGGVVRALTDARVFPQEFAFVTPGIYLLMLGLAFVDAYFKLPLGWLLLAANLYLVTFKTDAYLLVLLFAIPATAASLSFFRGIGIKINYLIILAIFAHMLDAASTYIAIDIFNCGEQHVLANFFISATNTGAVMFPLKLIALALIVKFFEEIEDPDTRAYFYWVVAALGIGPGIRNILVATIGLCMGFH